MVAENRVAIKIVDITNIKMTAASIPTMPLVRCLRLESRLAMEGHRQNIAHKRAYTAAGKTMRWTPAGRIILVTMALDFRVVQLTV
jgi:hypothetical protein